MISINKSVEQAVFFDILPESVTENAATPQDIRDIFTKYRNTFIPDGVSLTIQLSPGVYQFTTPLLTGHWRGNNIMIKGAPTQVANITTLSTYNNTAKTLSFTVSSGAMFAVGDHVMITDLAGGTRYLHARGVYRVTAVSGNTVTVAYPYKKDMAVFSGTTITSGKMHKFGTALRFAGCHGIYAEGMPSAQLWDIAVVGDGTGGSTYGIYLHISSMYNGSLLGVTGFAGVGIYIDNNANLERYGQSYIASCGNTGYGLYVLEGGSFYPGIEFDSSCNGGGISLADGGLFVATTVCVYGNGSYGLVCKGATATVSTNLFIGDNGNYGLYAWMGGKVYAEQLWTYVNATYDIIASTNAIIYTPKQPNFIQNAVTNPAKNTISTTGGYIAAMAS